MRLKEDMEKKIPKDDGLLTFEGRPSLYFPAVRAGREPTPNFPRRLAGGLGTAKFLCGACLALLGGMAVYVQASSAWMYGGIWSGLFAIFTGLCIILASRQPARPSLLIALLILSVLGFFNTGLLATFTAMGLVAEVYMEDVAGALVWKGIENASPFTVQLLLLATATADSLLSLACCVISGREVCCCGHPTPALLPVQRRDRLITWLASSQPDPPNAKVMNLPPVRLVPSSKQTTRPCTPSLQVISFPTADINESSNSSTGTTTQLDMPLVNADELGKSLHRMPKGSVSGSHSQRDGRDNIRENMVPRATSSCMGDKYLELDRKLSEEFIDRSLIFERSRSTNS